MAVTGAMLQMAASGAAGTAVALLAWDWALPNAIVFGMTLSCASTVVVMKALELRKLSVTPSGQVAIGWLVVPGPRHRLHHGVPAARRRVSAGRRPR